MTPVKWIVLIGGVAFVGFLAFLGIGAVVFTKMGPGFVEGLKGGTAAVDATSVEFSSATGGYRVKFPCRPTETSSSQAVEGGQIIVSHTAKCSPGLGEEVNLIWFERVPNDPETAKDRGQAVLTGMLGGMAKGVEGLGGAVKVEKEAEGTWEQLPFRGAEASVTAPGEKLRARVRVLVTDQKVFGLMLIEQAAGKSRAKAFFESFHVVD